MWTVATAATLLLEGETSLCQSCTAPSWEALPAATATGGRVWLDLLLMQGGIGAAAKRQDGAGRGSYVLERDQAAGLRREVLQHLPRDQNGFTETTLVLQPRKPAQCF